MAILVTGAFGNVGQSALSALTAEGVEWIAFDMPGGKNRALARRFRGKNRVVFGDVRDPAAIRYAIRLLEGSPPRAVIHLAAVIPPASAGNPALAKSVNVDGTENVVRACEGANPPIRLIHASSIAVYGDRVRDYDITVDDPLAPCDDDQYAMQKVMAEGIVRKARCPWTILRLSYVVWRKKLVMDSLMFRMPLLTKIEVVHTEDAGRAFAHAATAETESWKDIAGKTFNIGGGETCRTDYRTYLDRMFALFGLGGIRSVSGGIFSGKGFHCGWLDSDTAERALHFRSRTIEDYYREVSRETRITRLFASLLRAPIIRWLERSSPYRP